ncbi:TadE/TadG family type IV pilus assembly protein [Aurantiacibacter sp. MUD61]|uniref:TadE/TadG family type IV pilus assembly protein n=1 Tax=Aurantiacibacter sp. MUD61 TaxID=3009083 RepID=UPI0022F085D8|nr:TadE/TadG family type IV pilus assembly protein [Aurantiacibacter sp. MUD61]
MKLRPSPGQTPRSRVMSRLARDRSGNVMAMFAASLFPLIALLGGGIDMGRGYLAQSRLQQACDAATLAARKRMGSQIAVDGTMPTDVAETGQRFFNLNFQDGAYGTENRSFVMTLEEDYSISANASVDVPTTLMSVFGFDEVAVSVDCSSILNFNDLDIMMVIDTTGSMRHTNAGDTLSRIESVKQVVRNFYTQIDSNKAPNTQIRYGFVPYATNVNVGHLLEDDWVVDSWKYQGRVAAGYALSEDDAEFFNRNYEYVSGTRPGWVAESTYEATWVEAAAGEEVEEEEETDEGTSSSGGSGSSGNYRCQGSQPSNTFSKEVTEAGEAYTETVTDPPAVLYVQPMQEIENGRIYRTKRSGSTCTIEYRESTNYTQTYEKVRAVPELVNRWRYQQVSLDVSAWRTEQDGCIEERDTYEITDYDNVDFTRALDLDIDLVPSAGDSSTQWRPRYPEEIFVRKILNNGTGSFWTPPFSTEEEYADSGTWWFSDCPPAAQGLQEMSSGELDTYLDTLVPYGATYHDLGMIWGGRLISPTGLFASQNADIDGRTRGRHMIWLTDGQTEPYDLAYGAYGVDGLDQRRWNPSSSMTLAQTVENRFSVACEQVKNRNITVWVVAFGTTLNPIMEECGGPGRTFEAANAEELNEAFMDIARSMSELRVSR